MRRDRLAGNGGTDEKAMRRKSFRVIGIAGAKESGKSTIANLLVRENFYQLREMSQPIRWLFGDATGRKADPQRIPRDRDALNEMGKTLRYFLGEDVFIRMALASVPFMEDTGTPGIVIPGIRFKCEVDAIHEAGGEVWKVTRPGYTPDGSMYEPTDLDNDKVIYNNGTEHELGLVVRDMLNG